MKMHVLDLGKLTIDENSMVAGTNIPTRSEPHKPNSQIDIPVSSYCIEHPDGNLLFDLGCHPDAMGPDGRWSNFLQELCPYSGGEECQLPNRLEQLGLGPNDIRYAVLSHMHNDHAGCVEYFRNSKIIVHEDEFSAAMRTFGMRQFETPYVLPDIKRWTETDLDWHLIHPDIESVQLVDGVDIINLGSGHSHGMLALHVRLRGSPSVILASDAIYGQANYDYPPKMPGVAIDSVGMRRSVERIRALAKRTTSDVWFGHDMAQFSTLTHSTEGYYE